MAAVGWAASVVAADGLLSLGTGLEVMPIGAAGPVAEPAGVAVALLAIAWRATRSTARSTLLPVETLLLAAVSLIVVPAAVTLLMGGGGAAVLVLGRGAASVFTAVDALLAAVAGLLVLLVVRARDAGAGPPRWPWEKDDPLR